MKRSKIFEDTLKIVTGAVDTALSLRQQFVHETRLWTHRLINKLDVVPRSELEVVRSIAAQARADQQKLQERLDQLEQQLRETKKIEPSSNTTSL